VLVERLQPPVWQDGGNWEHVLGTDRLGRDILSRLMYGARISLTVCALAILFAGTVGTTLGIIAGYFGGWWETLLMRLVDLAMSFPVILLALLFGVIFGPGFANVVIVVSLVLWSQYARMARGETLKIKHSEYVDLARCAGWVAHCVGHLASGHGDHSGSLAEFPRCRRAAAHARVGFDDRRGAFLYLFRVVDRDYSGHCHFAHGDGD